jgi:hypothetical protein
MNTPAELDQDIWRYARGNYTPEQRLVLDECVENSEEILALNGKSTEGRYSYFTHYEYSTEHLTVGLHRIDGFFEGSLFIQAQYTNQAQEVVSENYVFMGGSSTVRKYDGDPFDADHDERATEEMNPDEIVQLSELVKFVKQAPETKLYPRSMPLEKGEHTPSAEGLRILMQDLVRNTKPIDMHGGSLQELKWKSQGVSAYVYSFQSPAYQSGSHIVSSGITVSSYSPQYGGMRDSLEVTLNEGRPGSQRINLYRNGEEYKVTDQDLLLFHSMLEYLSYSADYNSWNKAAHTIPGSAR